jgi:hypothetical protein
VKKFVMSHLLEDKPDLLAGDQRPVLASMSEEQRQETHVDCLEQPGRVIREHYFYRIYDADSADRPFG